jgi:hypothetical protein
LWGGGRGCMPCIDRMKFGRCIRAHPRPEIAIAIFLKVENRGPGKKGFFKS